MKFEMNGELKREVVEAAGNRGGGRCGTARNGKGKWVDPAGRLHELRVIRPSDRLPELRDAMPTSG